MWTCLLQIVNFVWGVSACYRLELLDLVFWKLEIVKLRYVSHIIQCHLSDSYILSLLENLDLLLFLLYSVSSTCLFDEEVLYEELDSLEVHMLVTMHLQDNINSKLKWLVFNVEFNV